MILRSWSGYCVRRGLLAIMAEDMARQRKPAQAGETRQKRGPVKTKKKKEAEDERPGKRVILYFDTAADGYLDAKETAEMLLNASVYLKGGEIDEVELRVIGVEGKKRYVTIPVLRV